MGNLPGKSNYLGIWLDKLKFFLNLPGKVGFFLPGSMTHQNSNQIDAAEINKTSIDKCKMVTQFDMWTCLCCSEYQSIHALVCSKCLSLVGIIWLLPVSYGPWNTRKCSELENSMPAALVNRFCAHTTCQIAPASHACIQNMNSYCTEANGDCCSAYLW